MAHTGFLGTGLDGSGVDALPDEILSEIQSLATHMHTSDTERYFFPATLSRVSRRWKDSTYSSPKVWSFIFIDENLNSERLPARMKRTGSVLLTIKIFDPEAYLKPTDVLEHLLPTSDRWATLSLNVDPVSDYAIHFPSKLPNLRHITLIEENRVSFTVDIDLPGLKYLRLHGVELFWNPSIRFTNLTELRAKHSTWRGETTMAKLIEHLRSLSKLEVLELRHSYKVQALTEEEIRHLKYHVLDLPHLRLLRLGHFGFLETTTFLSLLRAPSLRKFTFNTGDRHRRHIDIDQARLSFPSLEVLALEAISTPLENIVYILAKLPTIKTLVLIESWNRGAGAILEMILSNPALGSLTSRLTRLSVQGMSLDVLHKSLTSPASQTTFNMLKDRLTLMIYKERAHSGQTLQEAQLSKEKLRDLGLKVEATDNKYMWD